jgi:hypothetical protein
MMSLKARIRSADVSRRVDGSKGMTSGAEKTEEWFRTEQRRLDYAEEGKKSESGQVTLHLGEVLDIKTNALML